MSVNVPLLVGWRYVRAKRRNQFISFISGFSLFGMGIGVMALIIVMSVLNGFDRQIKDSILKVVPHGTVETPQTMTNWQEWANNLEQHPDIIGAAPYISGIGALSGYGGEEGVELYGVDPQFEPNVSIVHASMRQGELNDLQGGEYRIVLGRVLAQLLHVTLGDRLWVTTSQLTSSVLGPRPIQRQFVVSGIFETGGIVDQNVALIHIDDAQKMFRIRNGVQGIRVKVNDIYQAGTVLSQIRQQYDDELIVRDWSQTQGSLFKAVKQEKILTGILQMCIVAIAALNIVSGLVLMVADKRFDIAVLRTLGLTAKQVMAVFMVQGTSVGLIGLLVGAVIGSATALYFSEIFSFFEDLFGVRLFDPAIYYTSRIPSDLYWSDVVVVVCVAFGLSILSTLYPAFRASKIAPAEALRYE